MVGMLARLVTALRPALSAVVAQPAPPLARLSPALRLLAGPVPAPVLAPAGCRSITLETLHKRLQNPKPKIKKRPLDGNPQMKGVVLKTLIKKPKKPNSANRRCCLVRLSNGKEMVAYIPGEGHNLQEHNIVLVRVGRLRDVPGVKIKCIRGKYDLSHVVKKTRA